MFEVRLKTLYKDGRETDTVASAEHFIEFEEHFDEAFATAMTTGRILYTYYLSWLTAESGLEFKEWVKTIRDCDPAMEVATPFEKGPSEGSPPT